jgi:hypothetical protein
MAEIFIKQATREIKMKRAIIILVLFVEVFMKGNTTQAEQITKPYNFQAGEPAKAKEVNENFDVLYNKVNQMNKPIIWSGGCGNDGNGSLVYCTDNTDFNTAQGYLQTTNEGIFTVLVSGFYRINAFANYHFEPGSGKVVGISLIVNGTNLEAHNYSDAGGLNAGDTFYIYYYSYNSNYSQNITFKRWTPNNSGSRLQVSYLGQK